MTIETGIVVAIVSFGLGTVGMYLGFINNLRSKVAVLETKVESLKNRVDSHSKKQDDVIAVMGAFKQEVANMLNEIAIDIAKINTKLNLIEDSAVKKKGARK